MVKPPDIVSLHRAVRCYPDHQRCWTPRADHAKRPLVFSHPPRKGNAGAKITERPQPGRPVFSMSWA